MPIIVASQMPAPAGRALRTRAYGVLSRILPARIGELRKHRAGRLLIRAGQSLVAGGEVTITAGAGGGLLLDSNHLPIGHPLGFGIMRGVAELPVQEALRRSVAPGMTVYDIGADIGFFSLLSARLTGADGRVEAFEPVPDSAEAIRANARLNGFGNIGVHEVAVGDREYTETLLVPADRSWSHLADRGTHPDTRRRYEVEVIQLDERIDRGILPPPDVLKLDVEGSEGAVLRGLGRTLRSRPVVIVCELHETNAEVCGLLSDMGYAVENLEGTAPILDAGPTHVLARPT